ncbi:hypothetical protein K1719_028264 [Acacia pycnantha]|nr:hypothetical protein K1719_028264 [Acacia pycnantha]
MADQPNAIMADQPIVANQAASLPTTEQSASASVTNKASSVVTGKRKAMKQRSKVWDYFSKFVNEKGEIKGRYNYCEQILACDPKNNGTTALNNHFANVCKKKPPPEEIKQGHLNYSAEGDKFNLVNWKFDQDEQANVTRWNSTYLMLETAQKFEAAFKRYEDKDPYFRFDLEDGVPEKEDWTNVRRMTMVLGHFYNLTNRISGSLYVTSNNFFREIYKVYRFLNEWLKSDVLELCNVASRMKEKFDKYWGDPMQLNKLLYIAVVLDPRYKLDWVQFALCKMHTRDVGEHLGVHIKEVLICLYNEYNQVISPSAQLETGPSNDTQDLLDHDDPSLKLQKLLDIEDQLQMDEHLGGRTSRTEVDRYLNEEIEPRKDDFDILNWWRMQCKYLYWPKRMQLISGRLHNTGPTLSEDGDIDLSLVVGCCK